MVYSYEKEAQTSVITRQNVECVPILQIVNLNSPDKVVVFALAQRSTTLKIFNFYYPWYINYNDVKFLRFN